MASADAPAAGSTPTKKSKRVRTGCLNCRRKKRKCDETRPSCMRCTRVGADCEWGFRLRFRSANQVPLPQSPLSSPTYHDSTLGSIHPHIHEADENEAHRPVAGPPYDKVGSIHNLSEAPRLDGQLFDGLFQKWDSVPARPGSSNLDAGGLINDGSNSTRTYSNPNTPLSQTERAAAHLLSLSNDISTPLPPGSSPELLLGAGIMGPEGVATDLTEESFEDGLFNPGSAYLDLHSTLRDHMIREGRSAGPTRHNSPCHHDEDMMVDSTALSQTVTDAKEKASGPDDETSFVLTEKEELMLWMNWLEEVAPWLDKFDHEQHFQQKLSPLAKSHPHVKYAILAVSARQLERQELEGKEVPSSLALYQQAIHHLVPQLATRTTHVIASCVVLCVLEMLSCSPKAWRRHLEGCATLLQAVGIHGFSGGLEQALFWCFARMDVCGGLISFTNTLIPVSSWVPDADLPTAIRLYRSSTTFDMHANQAVYLMAHVVKLLAAAMAESATGPFAFPRPLAGSLTERWKELWCFIDEWYETRPVEMQPIYVTAASGCFPTILFSNPAAISGNQMYHTAALLMLQHRPARVSLVPKPRSILWHARRIVGISMSNSHHGCWTNSLQPLWIAGKLFSSPEEHAEILSLLGKIEKESGWATKWRADDLREWWGDLEERE